MTAQDDGIIIRGCLGGQGSPSPADLRIVKSGPDAVQLNTNHNYVITVTNTGGSSATNLVVEDTLPEGVRFQSFLTTGNFTCSSSLVGTRDHLTCTRPNLLPTRLDSINVNVRFEPTGTFPIFVTNTASVAADGISPKSSSATTTVRGPADLTFVKTGPDTVVTGSNISWTIQGTNAGPDRGRGIYVNDTLPLGTTYVSASGSGWSCSLINPPRNVRCTRATNYEAPIGPLPPITITANVTAAPGSTLHNVCTASSQVDPTPQNPDCEATTTVLAQTADLSFQKAGPATIAAGGAITWNITGNNAGPAVAENVQVVDTVPAGVTNIAATGTGWACAVAGSVVTCDRAIASVGTIPPITISGTAPTTPGPITNTCTASSSTIDPTPTNPACTTTTEVTQEADLAVTKTAPSSVLAEATFTYTIRARNNGPNPALNAQIVDTLPAGVTYQSHSQYNGWSCAMAGQTLTCNRTSMPASSGNQQTQMAATVQVVAPELPTTLVNTATISSNTSDPVPGNNSSTVQTVVNATAGLSIAKTDSADPVYTGQAFEYYLDVTNVGPSAATNVTVTDQVPAELTLIAATGSGWTCTGAGNNLTCTHQSTLAVGEESRITVDVVAGVVNTETMITNTASVESGEEDSYPADNVAQEQTTILPAADLRVYKNVDNMTPRVGETVVFTVDVRNGGPSAATGVRVSEQLPTGYQFVSANPSQGTYNPFLGMWAVGNLAHEGMATLTLEALVLASGEYRNHVIGESDQEDPDPSDNEDEVTPDPVPVADLDLLKVVDNPTPRVGDQVVFTVVVRNNGPSDATNVTVHEQLPSGFEFVSAQADTGSYDSGTGLWNVGSLANGGQARLSLVARVLASGDYRNVVTATADEEDPTPPEDEETPNPTPVSDLGVTKTVDNATPYVGETVTFTVVVNNAGPSDATGVQVTEQLESGYSFVSAAATVGSYNEGTGLWTVGNLGNGESATLTLVALVQAEGEYRNAVVVSGNEEDPDPINDEDEVTPDPVPLADLGVQKMIEGSEEIGDPRIGGQITYTVIATNHGPSTASNVVVDEQLETGYSFVNADASHGAYDEASGLWTIGDLLNGESATLYLTVDVLAEGSYRNHVIILGDEEDPIPENNEDEETPTPVPVADLTLVKTADNMTPNVGDTIVFSVVISNAGPSTATNVVVDEQLETGYSFVSASATAGTYDAVTGLWTVGNLANGESATLTLTALVLAEGEYRNYVVGGGDEEDPTTPEDEITPDPTPVSDLSVVKSVDNQTPRIGDQVSFTVVVSNAGPSDATGVEVAEQLPSGLSYVGSSVTAGSYNAGTGVWSIGDLDDSASATLTLVAEVQAAGSYQNVVVVSGNEDDPDPENNQDESTPTPTAVANLSISKVTEFMTPQVGETITFQVDVFNAGPSDATGVVVTELVESGYSLVSAVPSLGGYDAASGLWAIGNLANGAGASLVLTVEVLAEGSYRNAVVVVGNEEDPDPTDNQDEITPDPVPVADLQLVKTADSMTPSVGDNITFSVVVSNAGPSSATNVVVTEQLETGYSFVSSSATQGAYDAGTGLWTVGNLANGDSATLTLVATVLAEGSYRNYVVAEGDEDDPTLPEDEITPDPTPIADLHIVKTADTMTPNVGDNITFSVVVSNAGPSDATNVVVTEQLETGYSFVSANATQGAYDAGTGLWTVGNLANGDSATLTLVATVLAEGSYRNYVVAGADEDDPTLPEDEITPDPTPIADLSLVKTADTMEPKVGDDITFNVVVSNAGPSDATNVVVTEQLETGYSFVSANATQGAYDPDTGLWTVGTLPNGDSATLTLVATVLAEGNYRNYVVAGADEEDPTLPEDEITPDPVPEADLQLVKTADTMTPRVGDDITFSIEISNAGPSSATNVVVTEQLETGYSFVSANATQGAYDAGTGLWTVGTLANGGSATLTVVATVLAEGTYRNYVVAGADEDDPTDPEDEITPDPVPVSDLAIEKSANTDTPEVGEQVTFTIIATNHGPSDATGVFVREELEAGYEFVSSDTTAGNYDPITNVWTIGDLALGESVTMTLVASVLAEGSHYNEVVITGDWEDPNPDNNQDDLNLDPTPVANLSLVKTADTMTPKVGDVITFTIEVSNAGPSTATNVVVTEKLETGYEFLSAFATSGSYSEELGLWTVGDMANGETATLTLAARVLAEGEYRNFVVASSDNDDDPGPEDEITPDPTPVADLGIVKTVDKDNVEEGDEVVFTVVVTNHGPSDATGVLVAEDLPAGLEYVSDVAERGAYDQGVWTVGDLANGESVTLTMVATVLEGDDHTNIVVVEADQEDPSLENNQDTATVTLRGGGVDLYVIKTVDTDRPEVGQVVTFTVELGNRGLRDATGVQVTEKLPSGYTFEEAEATHGTYDDEVGLWTVGELASEQTATLTIKAVVLEEGDWLNQVVATSNEDDEDESDNSDEASTTPRVLGQKDVLLIPTTSIPALAILALMMLAIGSRIRKRI